MAGRFNWYLGDLADEVQIQGVRGDQVMSPGDASYLDPALVIAPEKLTDDKRGRAHLLVHRVTPGAVAQLIRARGQATIVDPRLHWLDDSFGYFRLRRSLTPTVFDAGHFDAVDRLFGLVTAATASALVVGTGPGSHGVLDRAADHDVRVVCNSAIRDPQLLEHVRPNVVAFGDHVFNFGPSRYAAAFRADVVRLAAETDCLFVVPEFGAELLTQRIPALRGRTVAVTVERGGQWRSITCHDTRVRLTGNVLTQYMLPVAFALAQRIDIAGCDGRQPGETYFWSHGPSVQYSDELMRSVFEAHLPFFRDNDYADYYEKHCAEVADMLGWAESTGRTVRTVTPSHIPALAVRSLRPTR